MRAGFVLSGYIKIKFSTPFHQALTAQHGPDARQIPFRAGIDYAGRESQNALFGDRIASTRNASFNVHFYWGVNPLEIEVSTTGNGSTGSTDSQLYVGSSAAGAASASAASKDRIYYRSGHDAYALFTARWELPADGLTGDAFLSAGIYDSQSGYGIKYDSNGLNVFRRFGSSDTLILQAEFNLDHLDGKGNSKFKLNTSNINIFRITYGYLGIAPAILEVYGGFHIGWIPFHVFDVTNEQTALILNFPFLPIQFEAGGTFNAAAYVHSGSWEGGIVGPHHEHKGYQHFAAESEKDSISTTLTNMLSIRPKATHNGVTNHIPITTEFLGAAAITAIGQAILKISVWRNATLGGAPNWLSVNANSSVEYDVSGTTLTGGDFLMSFLLTEGTSQLVQQQHGQIDVRPGEWLSIGAQTTTNTVDAAVSTRWQELF